MLSRGYKNYWREKGTHAFSVGTSSLCSCIFSRRRLGSHPTKFNSNKQSTHHSFSLLIFIQTMPIVWCLILLCMCVSSIDVERFDSMNYTSLIASCLTCSLILTKCVSLRKTSNISHPLWKVSFIVTFHCELLQSLKPSPPHSPSTLPPCLPDRLTEEKVILHSLSLLVFQNSLSSCQHCCPCLALSSFH